MSPPMRPMAGESRDEFSAASGPGAAPAAVAAGRSYIDQSPIRAELVPRIQAIRLSSCASSSMASLASSICCDGFGGRVIASAALPFHPSAASMRHRSPSFHSRQVAEVMASSVSIIEAGEISGRNHGCCQVGAAR